MKGWATERATGALDAAGLEHWCVSVGGDLQVRGQPGGGSRGRPWRIAVADPLHPGRVLASFDLHDGAVATSGTAERGRHLWDGRTGRPPGALASVTVLGPHLTWADALATAAFALGDAGRTGSRASRATRRSPSTRRGRLRVTAGLQLVGAAA